MIEHLSTFLKALEFILNPDKQKGKTAAQLGLIHLSAPICKILRCTWGGGWPLTYWSIDNYLCSVRGKELVGSLKVIQSVNKIIT